MGDLSRIIPITRRTVVLAAILAALPFAGAAAQDTGKGWVDLFDGETLEGWEQRGGEARYAVEDGVIVGTTVPRTPNSFLCTKKVVGDFVLELEFKADRGLNSGVQIRSNSLPGYKEGRVHGYQVEIDTSDRGWSGGIYDEGRRGWLSDLQDNREARYAFRQGEWNRFRVHAVGDSIRTWINGVPAADLVDSMTLRGFIALQVHGVGESEEILQVRWRNIRIKDLGASRWRPLFNGRDLDGWVKPESGEWTVANGILRGVNSADEKRDSVLYHAKKAGDFTARVVYRSNAGHGGLLFRSEKLEDGSIKGYRVEIDSLGKGAGGLIESGGREPLVEPDAALTEKIYGVKEWNELTVSAHGGRIVAHLNGTKTAEVSDDPGRRDGLLGLQLQGGQDVEVEFELVQLLDSTAPRPPDPPAAAAAAGGESDLPPVVPVGAEVVKIADGFEFTEGPAAGPDGRIYFSDIPNERIQVYDPVSGSMEVFRENSGRANGLMWTPAHSLIACEGGNRRVTRQTGGQVTVLAESFEGKRLNSPNDLALDGAGGIYFTDPRYGPRDDMEMDVEGVYYIPRSGKITRVVEDLAKPNGLVFSPDMKILYIADPGAATIWAYDVAGPGKLAKKRAFAEIGSDGMTVDERGNVYCTFKGEVWIFSPGGEEVARIKPPEAPANCTFGGPGGKTLFITARKGFYGIVLNVKGG